MTYVRVAVNVPSVAGVFDYEVPSELEARVGVGFLVVVPFGKQTVQGVILKFVDTPAVAKTRLLADVLDPDPVLTPAQIALAESVSESTLSPLAAVVELMLPAGLGKQADTLYDLRRPETQDLNQIQKRVVKLLRERGPLRGRQIDRHFAQVDWRRTAQVLVRRGVLATQSVLPVPSVRPKMIRTAQLAASPEAVEAALPELGKTTATRHRRRAVLEFLRRAGVPVNVAWVYAESGAKFPDLQELAERDLIELREAEIWRDPLEKLENIGLSSSPPVELTHEQRAAWSRIESGYGELAAGRALEPFLLHGVTGSGKTELYQRAAQEALRRGKQALILVPEIALTPQTVRRFLARFPGQVGIVHSKLSEGERFDTWRRARAGLLKVVIGPRSALFAPLKNLGLIVVDECHDNSYYQSEPPFYHAVDAAQAYARLAGALCILGSATPSTQQRFEAETGNTQLLELPRRIQISGGVQKFSELPPVSIVDMREELKSGERGIFSRLLADELAQTLKRGEQAILFLNRRGTATYVFCRQCGYVLKCPRCDTPLTFHVESKERLLCHHCGYERGKPRKCPQCASDQIREYGLGSEKVESEVSAMFPKARTLRWDWETTRQKDAHEIILSHFAAYRADVLVGTQMLAKGLDLPLVTLVGIVLADVGLNLPDPFAAERVFQVLTQVAGRAGRSERGGQVILQTFEPENRVIQAAARHDYAGFYADELTHRRQLGYPPFGRLVRLETRDQDAARAEASARQLAGRLQKWIQAEDRKETNIIGPVPCFFSKLAGYYRWQVVVRGPDPVSLLRGRAPDGWRIEVDPPSLL